MRFVDLDTWESRPTTKEEQAAIYIIEDAMEHLHLASPVYLDLEGVPPCMTYSEMMASRVRHTSKAIFQGHTLDSEIFTIQMAQALGMNYLGLACPAPPLSLQRDTCDSIYRTTEAGFPLMLGSGTVIGGTGPATIAGSTVTTNAELTGALVLIQLLRPGTGVLPEDFDFPIDMRRGHPAFGGVSAALLAMAFCQMWRKWHIPTEVGMLGYSSSKKIDFQSGYEKSLLTLSSALSGANVLQLFGCVHGELTAHHVMFVLDNDIAGWIGRCLEGINVSDETLALDLIDEVGPIPGHFLSTAHTREWWTKEQFVPKVADRTAYPEWIAGGKKDTLDLAKERAEEILATHKPKPLTPEEDKAIEDILEEAREYYRKQGLM
jgi:trimethylamine--corrinoid protein Co-methyltransferase